MIQLLLREGADPNSLSDGDRTPLMGSCFLRPGYSDELSLPAVEAYAEASDELEARCREAAASDSDPAVRTLAERALELIQKNAR